MHVHTSRGVKDPTGHGYHVSDRKQMACWGKKRQKDGMPKKASEKCFPALSTAAMSPSIIPLSSFGREKEDRGPGGVQGLDQRALASTSKRLGSPREFF